MKLARFVLAGFAAFLVLRWLVNHRGYQGCDPAQPHCATNEVCAEGLRQRYRCIPWVAMAAPIPPPFQDGTAFQCWRGPRGQVAHVHTFPRDVLGVDLSTPATEEPPEVFAPRAGELTSFSDYRCREPWPASSGKAQCVEIWDGTDMLVIGNLATVEVAPGRVEKGDYLGQARLARLSGQQPSGLLHIAAYRPAGRSWFIRSFEGTFPPTPVRLSLLALAEGDSIVPVSDEQLRCGSKREGLTAAWDLDDNGSGEDGVGPGEKTPEPAR